MLAHLSDLGFVRGTAAVLGALLGLCVACSDSSKSTPDDSPGALRGKLQVIQVEGYGKEAGAKYFLQVDGSERLLRLEFDDPPDWVPGTPLRVYGYQQGEAFQVTDYEVDQSAEEGVKAVQEALIGQPVTRSRTLTFVMVDMGSGVNIARDEVQSFMFSTTNAGPRAGISAGQKSVVQYFDETSYGMFQFSGAVEGPLSWSGEACSDYGSAMARSLSGQIATKYNHYIWYYGSVLPSPCGYGWGSEGTWNSPAGNVWFNGDLFGGAIPHELGHNLGLLHASSIKCSGVPLADNPMNCTTGEYADPQDIMGNLYAGHMMGSEKWYAGLFGGCNAVRVKSSGAFTLFPIEIPCNGIQTLQIPMPKTTRTFTTEQSSSPTPARYYYLELRQAIGLDTGLTPQVAVRISDDIKAQSTYCARNAMLDMNPSTTALNGMTAGQSYTDPAGGVTFAVDTLDTTKATITVTLATSSGASTCLDGSTLAGSGPDSCGSGGSGGTGGAGAGGTATGGRATGGTATGGTATGGNATGGTASGGKASGGTATGGRATGGTATGGNRTGGSFATTGGTLSTGGNLSTGGTSNSGGNPTAGGTISSGGGGASSGGASTGGSGGDLPNPETGCSCRTAASHTGPGRFLGLLGLVALGFRRRRSRR